MVEGNYSSTPLEVLITAKRNYPKNQWQRNGGRKAKFQGDKIGPPITLHSRG